MWYHLLIAFLLTLNCQAFNIDTYEPIVRKSLQMDDFDDPVNKDMFGYRVKLYNRTDGPRFIVGAPRGSVDGVMRPDVDVGLYNLSYGVVYSCPVDTGVCEGFNETSGKLYDNTANDRDEQKNGQLMGATIEVGGLGILVCAPRHFTEISNELHPFGKCYRTYGREVTPTFSFVDSDEFGNNPTTLCERESGVISPSHITTSVCQAGISGVIRGTSEFFAGGDGLILVGVPGLVNWEGGFAVYGNQVPAGIVEPFEDRGFGQFQTQNALMGYDIKYFRSGSSNSDPNIVVSATGINSLTGFIRFYRYLGNQVIRGPLQTVNGTKVGSNFGASLATVDLNGDGFEEIVVGAPTYSEDDGNNNIGQIHIYTRFTGEFILFRAINGMEPNAQFGFALVSLGDIDNNQLEDFAVGAPFGSGSGTVYIFNGVGGDEMIRQTQVIVGSELSLTLSQPNSFGFSFSNGLDVDGNGYPDFAVGSYLSQQVYLFRSRPVANMSLSFYLSSDFLNLDGGLCMFSTNMMFYCVRISACFNYSGLNVPNQLDINHSFVIERRVQRNSRFSRAFFENGASSTNDARPVSRDMISCVNDTIYLRNNTEDLFTPISVEFDMFLDPIVSMPTDGNTALSSLRSGTVLRIIGSNQIQIPLVRNCGTDARCIPNLVISNGSRMVQYEVNGEVDDTIETIAAGVVTAIVVPIQLLNNGNESALGPTVTFFLPQGTRFIRAFDIDSELTQICSETDVNNLTQVECDMGFTTEVGKIKNYSFRIQTRGIIGSEENLSITFTANNSLNEDTDPSDNSHTVYFTVTAEADVFIQSSFRPDSVQIGRTQPADITEVAELGPAVSGLFVVRNSGPSVIPNLLLTIFWPSMGDSDGNFIIYPARVVSDRVECDGPIDPRNYANSRKRRQSSETQDINCRNGHSACIAITCSITNLRANESSIIMIEGFVHDSSFLGTTNLLSLTAFSHVDIIENYITQPIGHQQDNDTATLMGIPPNLDTGSSDDGVEAWVIIVPIVVAIIIIVVAAILLYFFGFFKRKKVGDDEADLTTWQSPGDAGGEKMPQETESSPATKDSA